MVPSSYHEFFGGAVTVCGALIGLLFVAVSISPHKLAGDKASTEFQVRAGMAFTLLTSALVVSLVALLPEQDLGVTCMVTAVTGISSVVGLAAIALREIDRGPRRVFTIVRFVFPGLVFVVEFVFGLSLHDTPRHTDVVEYVAFAVLASFLIAIDRAWEMLGGSDSGFIRLLIERLRNQQVSDNVTQSSVVVSRLTGPSTAVGDDQMMDRNDQRP
jgi:hypothetical protein